MVLLGGFFTAFACSFFLWEGSEIYRSNYYTSITFYYTSTLYDRNFLYSNK